MHIGLKKKKVSWWKFWRRNDLDWLSYIIIVSIIYLNNYLNCRATDKFLAGRVKSYSCFLVNFRSILSVLYRFGPSNNTKNITLPGAAVDTNYPGFIVFGSRVRPGLAENVLIVNRKPRIILYPQIGCNRLNSEHVSQPGLKCLKHVSNIWINQIWCCLKRLNQTI